MFKQISSLSRCFGFILILAFNINLSAITCENITSFASSPKAADTSYSVYEVFVRLPPGQAAMMRSNRITTRLDLSGIEILNRKTWQDAPFLDANNFNTTAVLKVKIVDETQFKVIKKEFVNQVDEVKLFASGKDLTTSPIKQRLQGHIELGRISKKVVHFVDRFYEGKIPILDLVLSHRLYQKDYTYNEAIRRNKKKLYERTKEFSLSPGKTHVSVWGKKGDDALSIIGEQSFHLRLTDPKQVNFIFKELNEQADTYFQMPTFNIVE